MFCSLAEVPTPSVNRRTTAAICHFSVVHSTYEPTQADGGGEAGDECKRGLQLASNSGTHETEGNFPDLPLRLLDALEARGWNAGYPFWYETCTCRKCAASRQCVSLSGYSCRRARQTLRYESLPGTVSWTQSLEGIVWSVRQVVEDVWHPSGRQWVCACSVVEVGGTLIG